MRTILLMAVAVGLCASPAAAQPGCGPRFGRRLRVELPRILHDGGFGAVIDDAVVMTTIGCHRVGRAQLAVILYERVWGEASRMTRRVMIVSSTRGFLGMYGPSERPTGLTADGRIRFPFPEDQGASISLADGRPPARVRLGGEMLTLFR